MGVTQTGAYNKTYLTHAKLSGYRTIEDVEVEFLPGLNIIIGPNGSGKTNLIEFLEILLAFEQEKLKGLVDAHISWIRQDDEKQRIDLRFQRKIDENLLEEEETSYGGKRYLRAPIENKFSLVFEGIEPYQSIEAYRGEVGVGDNPIFPLLIPFNVPDPLFFFNAPYHTHFRFSHSSSKGGIGLVTGLFESDLSDKIDKTKQVLADELSSKLLDFLSSSKHDLEEGKVDFEVIDKFILGEVNRKLKLYTPVSEVRFDRRLRTHARWQENTSERYKTLEGDIDNVFLEFKLGKHWLSFNQLSDGTQRIIYIVMSLVLRSSRESKGAFKLFHAAEDLDRTHNIILLEEPELGIHPDQLFQLMTFIREVAEENQVILTTHAPQVLDFLEPDELDRIITTSISDRGTLIRKLSDEKKKSIQAYMQEEGFLRDYWIHLDLEDA